MATPNLTDAGIKPPAILISPTSPISIVQKVAILDHQCSKLENSIVVIIFIALDTCTIAAAIPTNASPRLFAALPAILAVTATAIMMPTTAAITIAYFSQFFLIKSNDNGDAAIRRIAPRSKYNDATIPRIGRNAFALICPAISAIDAIPIKKAPRIPRAPKVPPIPIRETTGINTPNAIAIKLIATASANIGATAEAAAGEIRLS